MFFGATSNAQLHKNQERLWQLSPETLVYEGNAQKVEQQIQARKQETFLISRRSQSATAPIALKPPFSRAGDHVV